MNLDDEIAADVPAATDPYLGSEFGGRYRVEERVSAGGMGTVYRGTHIELGTTVAIKVLHRHLATAKGSMLYQRFRNEARIAAQLKHPNIAQATDFGRTGDNVPYLVMEFLEGEPLSSYLESHAPLAPAQAADIACGVLEALHAAHSVGIVHRDIKPDNVFIVAWEDGRPHVKVLDFGIAKLGDATVQTQAGHVLGTMAYMSPEQLQDTSQVDVRTDVYAVGVTLYQMLSGILPFQSASLTDLALLIMKGEPPRLQSQCPDVPSELATLVHRAIAASPTTRPPSALAFLDELTPYASPLSESAAHGPVAPAVVAGDLASADPRQTGSQLAERDVKSPALFKAFAAGAMFLLALGLLAWFFASPHDDLAAIDNSASPANEGTATGETSGTRLGPQKRAAPPSANLALGAASDDASVHSLGARDASLAAHENDATSEEEEWVDAGEDDLDDEDLDTEDLDTEDLDTEDLDTEGLDTEGLDDEDLETEDLDATDEQMGDQRKLTPSSSRGRHARRARAAKKRASRKRVVRRRILKRKRKARKRKKRRHRKRRRR